MNRRHFLTAMVVSLWTLLLHRVGWAAAATSQRSLTQAPPGADPRAALVDDPTFALMGEMEMRRAVRLHYYVALLVVQVARARGGRLAGREMDLVVDAIRDEVRGVDVITVSTDSVQVLLVSPHVDDLPGIVARIVRAVDRRTGDGPQAVTLSIGGTGFPKTARSWVELRDSADWLSRRARVARKRRGHRAQIDETEWDAN